MSGLDIDTRSDIYSLGVMLYELLTGTTPFDARELLASGLEEMRRTIREKEKILAAIHQGGLADCTRMPGYQPHRVVMEEARRHYVFLSPSVTAADGDTEGGAPVSIIEMSASGMMIVSTKHCDIPGVILDGKTGLLAPENDVDTLVEHLQWIVAHPERWLEMQRAGRSHMEAEFDARLQGERLAAVYRELAAARAATGGAVT